MPTTTRSARREKVSFQSDGTPCAAWHYPGVNGACVVMSSGFGVPKEPATDRFARAFHEAGFSVLAFDYRWLGESGGEPRLIQPVKKQLHDWDAAIRMAATLPEVDPQRIAAWGFSLSGGHIFAVAARNPTLAAAIAQNPTADGRAATRNAMRHQKPGAMLKMVDLAIADMLRGMLRRDPILVPLAAPPGTAAMLTTPDAIDGGRILDPDGSYPEWQQVVAARSTLPLGSYRPGKHARKVQCPLLVVVSDQDQTALAAPAIKAARKAPYAEVVELHGEHFAAFLDAHDDAVRDELEFLRRHLLPAS
jgi:pimeloyl-ACP methyl ester carboxylesterase